jgi:hypothetical protein
MWDPTLELVVAMNLEGCTTCIIGPLSGRQYYQDFIPFITSSTGNNRYFTSSSSLSNPVQSCILLCFG